MPTFSRYFSSGFDRGFQIQIDSPSVRQGEARVNFHGPIRQSWTYNGAIGQVTEANPSIADWKNPRGTAYPIDLRSFSADQPLRNLIGQDIVPGKITEWLTPKGPAYPLDLRTFLGEPLKNLIGEDPTPGKITEWIVPKGYPFAIPLRWWEQDHVVNTLQGQDVIYGDPGQAPTVNLANPPKGPKPVQQPDLSALQDLLLALSIMPPSFAIDLALPHVARRLLQDWIIAVSTQLIGQDRLYGDPGQVPARDLPNPLPAKRLPQPLGPQDTIYQTVDSPFGPVTWVVPPGPTRAIDLRSWLQDGTGYIGQDRIYDGPGQVPQYEWPVTHDYAREHHVAANNAVSWVWQDAQGTVFVEENPAGKQLVVMRVPAAPRVNPDWQHRTDIQLIGQDALYGEPGEVPVRDLSLPPTGPKSLIFNRTHVYDEPRILIGQDQFFGAPGESPTVNLPNPVRPLPHKLVDDFTATSQLLLFFPVGGQLMPMRIVLDKARLRPDHIVPAQIQLIGQDALYGAPGEVPSANLPLPPKGYPYPVWLRTLIDRHVTDTLRDQDTIYAAPGQVPTVAFPNPLRGPPKRWDEFIGSLITGLNLTIPEGKQLLPVRLDFDKPRKRIDQVLPLPIQLIGQDTIYAAPGEAPNYNLPNPPRGYPYPSDLRGWLNTYRLIIGQDVIYAAPGEVPVYEWPVPKGYPYPRSLRSWLAFFARIGVSGLTDITLDASLDMLIVRLADHTSILTVDGALDSPVRQADYAPILVRDADGLFRLVWEIDNGD